MTRESGFYWIESPLHTGTPIIAYYTSERNDWTIAGTAARHIEGVVCISDKLRFIPKVTPPPSTWSHHLTADELIKGLLTLKSEDHHKPLCIELGFSGDRVLPFNAHDAWCQAEGDIVFLKVQ